ncbi:MAG: HlyD family efflux transporter periplasmic adaptor subunit [Anaerolineae bacterium]|nr:HlyD family efflux transporter periplasmic adaptor subunit [Anaerolineae bacterium]
MKQRMCCVLVVAIFLTGCGALPGRAASHAPILPPVTVDRATVVAEGSVEPSRWLTLRAPAASQVTDVLVEEGDWVSSGGPIIALDAEDAGMAVRQAEAALAVAEAKLAEARAEVRPETLALMDAQVLASTAALSQSIAALNASYAGRTQAEAAAARADILSAQVAYDAAVDAHDETMKCYDVQQEDGTKREICPALGTFEGMARAKMAAAMANLEAAQVQLDTIQRASGTSQEVARAGVVVAEAQVDAALASREQAVAGGRSETVAVARAAVDRAQAAVATALAHLEATTFTMPFNGTVVACPIEAGEAVSAGAPLIEVATLDDLRIRTRDLTELDVVRVAVGQGAVIRADARPDHAMRGCVSHIEPQSRDYLGDVTYAVLIELESVPSWLRWGMTVDVEIGDVSPDAVVPAVAPAFEARPIAEAVVVPAHDIDVGTSTAGRVAAVSVHAGAFVERGDVLLQLDDGVLATAVAEARADLAAAEAALALAQAGAQPETIAEAEAAVQVAEAEVARVMAERDHLSAQLGEPEISALESALAAAGAEKREIEAYLHWAEDDGDEERAAEWRLKLAAANQEIAAIEMAAASVPRERWARLQAAEAAVRTAEANRAAAEAKLALLRAGPRTETVAVAEAVVAQAILALAQAEEDLARAVVRAPQSGTIATLAVEVGDYLLPGQPVVTIADLDHLELRTVNLMEVDVVHVMPGQPATIKLDALPDQALSGTVVRVGLQQELYREDVTYPVTIALAEQPEALRWGMSAVVEFHP